MAPVPRRFLRALEPIVSCVWMMPPETVEEYSAAGIADPMAGYVCGRAAPLGRASTATVAAAFFNFNPTTIEANLRWGVADPTRVLEARERGVARVLGRLLGEVPEAARASDLMRGALAACRPEGRMLFAANAALPWSSDPLVALWQGGNLLREYRGDGHIAVLLTAGLDGPSALALNVTYTGWNRDFFYRIRGWPAETYRAAEASLIQRGLLDQDLSLTDAGAKFKEMIEADTDRAASAPFDALGHEACEELLGLLEPLGVRIVERKGISSATTRIAGRL